MPKTQKTNDELAEAQLEVLDTEEFPSVRRVTSSKWNEMLIGPAKANRGKVVRYGPVKNANSIVGNLKRTYQDDSVVFAARTIDGQSYVLARAE